MKLPEVIFENDFFIAVNKPSGLLSIPDRQGKEISIKDLLQQQYHNIYTVHRLDKDTSGIIIFAKDEATHKQLSQLFEARETEKYYFALVHGSMENSDGSIDAPIMEHPIHKGKMIVSKKGKPSVTHYEVLEDFHLFSWLKLRMYTGRTHQIRIHIQHIGHSIVCDELYGHETSLFLSSLKHNYKLSKKEEAEKPILSRLALHAHSLKFSSNGKEYYLKADLPKDLNALLQQLRKLKKQ